MSRPAVIPGTGSTPGPRPRPGRHVAAGLSVMKPTHLAAYLTGAASQRQGSEQVPWPRSAHFPSRSWSFSSLARFKGSPPPTAGRQAGSGRGGVVVYYYYPHRPLGEPLGLPSANHRQSGRLAGRLARRGPSPAEKRGLLWQGCQLANESRVSGPYPNIYMGAGIASGKQSGSIGCVV